MPDWDDDGKDTWKDDYTYHEVLGGKKHTSPSRPRSGDGSWKVFWAMMGLIALWEVLKLVAGMIY